VSQIYRPDISFSIAKAHPCPIVETYPLLSSRDIFSIIEARIYLSSRHIPFYRRDISRSIIDEYRAEDYDDQEDIAGDRNIFLEAIDRDSPGFPVFLQPGWSAIRTNLNGLLGNDQCFHRQTLFPRII
jgi:hypothetical protein